LEQIPSMDDSTSECFVCTAEYDTRSVGKLLVWQIQLVFPLPYQVLCKHCYPMTWTAPLTFTLDAETQSFKTSCE